MPKLTVLYKLGQLTSNKNMKCVDFCLIEDVPLRKGEGKHFGGTCFWRSDTDVTFDLYYKNSRGKFKPEPGFEPRTSGFLARRSTTSAILVLMPAHVQMSLLRRMPLFPGGAVMKLSLY